MHRAYPEGSAGVGTPCLRGDWASACDPALPSHHLTPPRRLGSEPQASRADLAAGRAEGATEAAEAEQIVVNRGILCASLSLLSYDFVMARTHDGQAFRLLTLIDEYTRECLAIEVSRRLDAEAVLYRLTELFVSRRPPDYSRSDNGPEFTARAVREWLSGVGVKTLTLNLAVPGRMVTTRASMGSCGMSCSTGSFSTPRPRS
jgi:transposase InsO family protein